MQNAFLFSATAVLLSVGAATAQTTTVVTPGQPVVVTQPQVTHVETTDPATTGGGAMGGATTGAVAGAVVGGPVGAAVGGIAGAIVGDATEDAVTPETRTYVLENKVQSVTLSDVAVGSALPETVPVQPIPNSQYQYVYVDDQPVIVEPQTRKVLYIVE